MEKLADHDRSLRLHLADIAGSLGALDSRAAAKLIHCPHARCFERALAVPDRLEANLEVASMGCQHPQALCGGDMPMASNKERKVIRHD